MNILNKIKWVVGLSLVFILILSTNLIDKRNFKKIRTSITSIYEDRLLAKGIIYEFADMIHQKEKAVLLQDSMFFTKKNNLINSNLKELLESFSETRLTPNEQTVFDKLSMDFNALLSAEKQLIKGGFDNSETFFEKVNKVDERLISLSKIQIKEGEKIFSKSEDTFDSIDLYTQVETYFLLFMAIMIQVVLLIKPKY